MELAKDALNAASGAWAAVLRIMGCCWVVFMFMLRQPVPWCTWLGCFSGAAVSLMVPLVLSSDSDLLYEHGLILLLYDV